LGDSGIAGCLQDEGCGVEHAIGDSDVDGAVVADEGRPLGVLVGELEVEDVEAGAVADGDKGVGEEVVDAEVEGGRSVGLVEEGFELGELGDDLGRVGQHG